MKVKIGNKIYDANEEPIMLILTDIDKRNIKRIPLEATKYCSYPKDFDVKEIEDFMKTEK